MHFIYFSVFIIARDEDLANGKSTENGLISRSWIFPIWQIFNLTFRLRSMVMSFMGWPLEGEHFLRINSNTFASCLLKIELSDLAAKTLYRPKIESWIFYKNLRSSKSQIINIFTKQIQIYVIEVHWMYVVLR